MSSYSGGFNKFRCKYFMSHECKNWVWVSNAACSTCMAMGRDEEALPPTWSVARDMLVPCINDGILQYTCVPMDGEEHAALQAKPLRPNPATSVATMMPRSSYTAYGMY